MALNQDQLAALFAEAAEAGTEAFNAIAKAKIVAEKAGNKSAEAAQRVAELKREASGFSAPRFKGMAKVAKAFGHRFNDPDASGADEAAKGAAESYMTTMTGATDKTKGGGRAAGVAKVVKLGTAAETVIFALQQRLEHWQAIYDSTPEGEDAAARKTRLTQASLYLSPASCDGDTPRHNGRPERQIGDVLIPASKGTNRDSQVAQAATMFALYGGAFLNSTVLDAFLDNGGRFEKPDATIAQRAAKLAGLLLEFMEESGDSPDKAELDIAVQCLDKIKAREGFAPSRAAVAAAKSAQTPVTVDNLDAQIDNVAPELVLSGEAAPSPAPRKGKKPGIAV